MNYDKIDELFEELDFDIQEPPKGHEERFLDKLKREGSETSKKNEKLRILWPSLLAVAACFLGVLLITGISQGSEIFSQSTELAQVSPELTETQQFYTAVIQTELSRIEEAKSPATQAIINDAFAQLEKLDADYEKLKKDLKKSGQDKRVVYAMISNFQQRIDLLNDVITRIETINELKNTGNENNYL